MKRQRDPERKKAVELARDHRVLPRQGNKTFRTVWPLKKAKANREVRRAESVATAAQIEDPDLVEQRVAEARSRRKRKLQKEGVVNLQEQLEAKQDIGLRWHRLMELNREARRTPIRRYKARGGLRK